MHLSYMLLPLLPRHREALESGTLFERGKHFPLAYVRRALEKLNEKEQQLKDDPDISTDKELIRQLKALDLSDAAAGPEGGADKLAATELIRQLKDHGVYYDDFYEEEMEKIKTSNALLANFSKEDFQYCVIDGQVCDFKGEPVPDASTREELDGQDKELLQNYGRPPAGMAKQPSLVYISQKFQVESTLKVVDTASTK